MSKMFVMRGEMGGHSQSTPERFRNCCQFSNGWAEPIFLDSWKRVLGRSGIRFSNWFERALRSNLRFVPAAASPRRSSAQKPRAPPIAEMSRSSRFESANSFELGSVPATRVRWTEFFESMNFSNPTRSGFTWGRTR